MSASNVNQSDPVGPRKRTASNRLTNNADPVLAAKKAREAAKKAQSHSEPVKKLTKVSKENIIDPYTILTSSNILSSAGLQKLKTSMMKSFLIPLGHP